MLLICQSLPTPRRGSQPFFSATVTWAGTPPDTPHRWAGATLSISDKAYSRAARVSTELGVTSCLSRAIWSSGVVVVSPQPGQANPGQTTHDDGAVWVRPALALNERILAAPPTAYHRLVAASLSLSSIICSASVRSLADRPVPSLCARSASRVSSTSSLTTLASACGGPGPRLVGPGPQDPAAARPATVPPAMTAQAPSVTSTTRMGTRGGLGPEPACLPLAPETDVLITLPIVSHAASARQARARR